MDFRNLQGKKVVVMGLGLLGGGVETVKWLVKQGANLLVTDLRTKEQLTKSLAQLRGFKTQYILGKHREQDFRKADLIIKNPGVTRDSKFLQIAKKNHVPIESDLSLFFRLFKGKIVGVTGTKGKSTTVSLLAHILKTAKKKFIFGGNIGHSPLNYLDKKYSLAVLELSSWQLEDMAHLKKSPQIAAVTTIFPDHLNTYKNFQQYVNAKKLIFKYQTKNDTLILNADDPIVRKFAKGTKAKVKYFFPKKSQQSSNILAATAIATALEISPIIIKKAIKNFRGVPNRQEFIREKNGIKYYNDSASTVPQSTNMALAMLASLKIKNIILISGGADKDLNFKEMARQVVKKCKAIILLPGTATPKLKSLIFNLKPYLPIFPVQTMDQAVKLATAQAEKNDIVLLSPGCASFGVFQNAYDRAAQFITAVKNL
jgi:UDP-N-acetylmuramoylalanine--D-glutamate ligase